MGLFRRKAAKPPASPGTPVGPAAPGPAIAEPAIAEPAIAEPAIAEPVTTDPATTAIDELRAELASLRNRLDAADRANADLEATVETLNQRLIVTAPPPAPPTAAPPPPPPVEPVEPVESVTLEQHAEMGAAFERLEASLGALDQRIDRLDERVTAVSTELANQLTEIGNDIEPMHDSAERLANEQARYQIQFRQDLAELAERIRRPGTP